MERCNDFVLAAGREGAETHRVRGVADQTKRETADVLQQKSCR